jgi:hypothetical protein
MEVFLLTFFMKCNLLIVRFPLYLNSLIVRYSCPEHFEADQINRNTNDNWALAAGNLRKLLRLVKTLDVE